LILQRENTPSVREIFQDRQKNLLTILCISDRGVLSEKVPKLLGGAFISKFKIKKRITTQDEGRFFDA
jgi:hypothetical protein